jgi:peptide deformylase
MAILKVANLGNPILRIPAEPVKNIQAPEIQRLIDDMIETMRVLVAWVWRLRRSTVPCKS